MTDWFKISSALVELIDNLNEYSTPEESVSALDNRISIDERALLLEFLDGYVDHKKIINLLVDCFYSRDGKNCLQKERSLYLAVSYLVIFSIDNYCLEVLDAFWNGYYKERFQKFMRFMLSEKNLLTYIKQVWLSVYNLEYVEANLINPVLKNSYLFETFLEDKANTPKNDSFKGKNFTIPMPFNFSGNVVRKILLPEPITQSSFESTISKPRLKKRRSISANFASSFDFEQSKKIKDERVKKTRTQPVKLTQEPSKYEKDHENPIELFKANPCVYKSNSIPVKINTALILREEDQMRKKIERFTNQFSDVEREIRNASDYWAWQRQVREEEIKAESERLEAQRLMSKQSLEDAIKAKNNLILNKQENAKAIAEEDRNLCLMCEEAENEILEEKQNAVNASLELRVNPRIAREKVLTSRKANAVQVANEAKKIELTALKKAEREMKDRIDVIQSIKSSESASMSRKKLVDLGESGRHGLLSEMSLVELKERLELIRQDRDWNTRDKHDRIVRTKRDWDSGRLEKLHYINSLRSEFGFLDEDIRNLGTKPARTNKPINQKSSLSNLNGSTATDGFSLPQKIFEQKTYLPAETVDAEARRKKYLMYSRQRDLLETKRLADIEFHREKMSRILPHESM